MAAFWKTPAVMVFLDEDNIELARVDEALIVPRAGENVLIAQRPFVVDRVGYDLPAQAITRVLVVCRPA